MQEYSFFLFVGLVLSADKPDKAEESGVAENLGLMPNITTRGW